AQLALELPGELDFAHERSGGERGFNVERLVRRNAGRDDNDVGIGVYLACLRGVIDETRVETRILATDTINNVAAGIKGNDARPAGASHLGGGRTTHPQPGDDDGNGIEDVHWAATTHSA